MNFYMSSAWQKKREQILRRDGYRCQWCRRYGRLTEADEVHHVKPLKTHPELALSDENLVSLCASCHRKAHPEKAKAARGRY